MVGKVFAMGALSCAVLFGAVRAEAQDNPAITAGREGLDAHSQGDWEGCEAHFTRANKLMHSPVFVLYVARCKAELGKLLEARNRYDELIGEAIDDAAPAPWRQAQQDAKSERAELAAAIPSLSIITGRSGATVSVDGEAVDGDRVEVDPGEHEVQVIALGEVVESRNVVVSRGSGVTEVHFDGSDSTGPTTEGSVVPGAVLLGVGGVGLLVGAVFGGLALDREADAKEGCDPVTKRCPAANVPAMEEAVTFSHVSTAGLVIGGVAAAVGVALLIWRPGGGAAEVSVRPAAFDFTLSF